MINLVILSKDLFAEENEKGGGQMATFLQLNHLI